MLIRETYYNETEGYRCGSSGWYEPYTEDKGKLFRSLQREYGGCISKMYKEESGKTRECGWVFSRREKYDDCDKLYVREVWVEVKE